MAIKNVVDKSHAIDNSKLYMSILIDKWKIKSKTIWPNMWCYGNSGIHNDCTKGIHKAYESLQV